MRAPYQDFLSANDDQRNCAYYGVCAKLLCWSFGCCPHRIDNDRADPSTSCVEERAKLVQMCDRGAMLDLVSKTLATILYVAWDNLLLVVPDVGGQGEGFLNCVLFFMICLVCE